MAGFVRGFDGSTRACGLTDAGFRPCQALPEPVAMARFRRHSYMPRNATASGPPRPRYKPRHAPVAQLDRALDYESRGQEFESLRARQSAIDSSQVFIFPGCGLVFFIYLPGHCLVFVWQNTPWPGRRDFLFRKPPRIDGARRRLDRNLEMIRLHDLGDVARPMRDDVAGGVAAQAVVEQAGAA